MNLRGSAFNKSFVDSLCSREETMSVSGGGQDRGVAASPNV